MSYAQGLLIIAAAIVVSGTLSWLVRTRVNLGALRRHHEVGSAVFLQLGVIYAVLLAFVFVQVWEQYNVAANAIDQECGALHGTAILAATLPKPTRHMLLSAEVRYLRSVVTEEWPALRRGGTSPQTRDEFDALLALAATPKAKEDRLVVRTRILALLADAHEYREQRLFQATLGLPTIFWVLLIVFGIALTGFLLCFGMDYVWSQVAFTSLFVMLLAFVLLLIAMLDYPFSGAFQLRPANFSATLHKLQTLNDDAS